MILEGRRTWEPVLTMASTHTGLNLALLLISCVALCVLLNISETQCSHLYNGRV